MAQGPLALSDLAKVAKFLKTLSDEDLNDKSLLLVKKKYPRFVSDLNKAVDVVSLIKYERVRRKQPSL